MLISVTLPKTLGGLAAIAAIMLAAAPANAVVVIDITQSAGNVDVSVTGSLNLTGATLFGTTSLALGAIIPSVSAVSVGAAGDAIDLYGLTSAGGQFGTSDNPFTAATASGTDFLLGGSVGTPQFAVPHGYTSFGSISASMILAGETIAGLTLIPGTYTYALPSDSIKVEIASPSAVPIPSTWALMLTGLTALSFASYRRPKQAAAAG